MNDKIKPCPFCGGEAVAHRGFVAFNDVEVHCEGCGLSGPNFGGRGETATPYDDAVSAWNTRAVDPAAIRKAALQEAADRVTVFTEAMLSIKHRQDEGERLVNAGSAMLSGARAAILALIEKDASDETA